jgi:steroid delta-isomerase-like uncharacterized protein
MSTELNKKIILRLYGEGIMQRKFLVFDELIADEFVNHGIPNSRPGPHGFRDIVEQLIQAFPDLHINIQKIVSEADTVATRGYFSGTHHGNFMGLLTSGKKVQIDYIDFWKIRNGKCVENWMQMDLAGVSMQLRPLQVAL